MRIVEIDELREEITFEDSAGHVIILRIERDKIQLTPKSRHHQLLLTTGNHGQILVGVM